MSLKNEYGFLLGNELLHIGTLDSDKFQLMRKDGFNTKPWTTKYPITLIEMWLMPELYKGNISSRPLCTFGKARPIVIITTKDNGSVYLEYRPAHMPKLLPEEAHIVDSSTVTGYSRRTIHLLHCPVTQIGTMYANRMAIGGSYFWIHDGQAIVSECIAYASKQECLLLELDDDEVALGLAEGPPCTKNSGSGLVYNNDDYKSPNWEEDSAYTMPNAEYIKKLITEGMANDQEYLPPIPTMNDSILNTITYNL